MGDDNQQRSLHVNAGKSVSDQDSEETGSPVFCHILSLPLHPRHLNYGIRIERRYHLPKITHGIINRIGMEYQMYPGRGSDNGARGCKFARATQASTDNVGKAQGDHGDHGITGSNIMLHYPSGGISVR